MSLIVAGISYKRTPLDVRERIARLVEDRRAALSAIMASRIASSALILSTCGRTEVYADTDDPQALLAQLGRMWGLEDIQAYSYLYERDLAVQHLFRLATGLDSAVIGETEILGQIKDAYRLAVESDCLNTRLMRLFERAFFASSCARQCSGISMKPPSLAEIAVKRARKEYPALADASVFVLGAGVVAQAVIEHLSQSGVRCVVVANRTFPKASELAGKFALRALKFEDFYKELPKADVVFSATASPHPVVAYKHLAGVDRPILFLDLAMPRDIDPAVADIPGMRVLSIDDISPETCRCYDELVRQAREIADEKARQYWSKETLAQGLLKV